MPPPIHPMPMQTPQRPFSQLLSIALLVGCLSLGLMADAVPPPQQPPPPIEKPDSGWRMTRYGWQDATNWQVIPTESRPVFELIDPIIWGALVLLLVLIATIWASSEWELARFFPSEQKPTTEDNNLQRPGKNGNRWPTQ